MPGRVPVGVQRLGGNGGAIGRVWEDCALFTKAAFGAPAWSLAWQLPKHGQRSLGHSTPGTSWEAWIQQTSGEWRVYHPPHSHLVCFIERIDGLFLPYPLL